MPPKRKSLENKKEVEKKKVKKVDSDEEEDGDNESSEEETTTSSSSSSGNSNHSFDLKSQYKFISWNVNGFNALLKKESYLEDLIKSEKPTCICLQETKLSSTSSKYEKLLKGYTAHFNHCSAKKGYSGTAVYTLNENKPIKVTFGMGIDKHDNEGRLICVEYEDLYLINTYVPNSGQKLERLDYRTTEWDVDMLNYLKNLEKTKPIVWTGDLNVAILDIDVHNPKGNKRTAGFTDEERKATPLIQNNFIDSYRMFHPKETDCYTYWGYRQGMRAKNKGWRLDYFICSQSLKEKIVDSYILKEVLGSDHCPIGIILNK
ncbi:hypothetical protein ABK040_000595 [Willaertia magna]